MGTFMLSKTNRLYWLGRYVERAYIAISQMEIAYDISLDSPDFDYAAYCDNLNIPNVYADVDDFINNYLFDRSNVNSAAASLDMGYDNAVVLRETLGSLALSYIQLAANTMDNAASSSTPMLDLQNVRDYLLAFKGCVDDFITDEDSRMIIKLGSTVEKVDMSLRLGINLESIPHQLDRLENRLRRTKMRRDSKYLRLLVDLVPCVDPIENKDILVECIENLFPDA